MSAPLPYWDAEGTIVGAGCQPEEWCGEPVSHDDCIEGQCACPCHLVSGWREIWTPGERTET